MSGNMNSDVEVAAANVITTSVLAAGAFPAANTDPTWVATNGNDINVGHVETSAALWDTATGAAAEMTADLANLQFLRGTNLVQPFLGIAAGDEISISYEKGGRDMDATFTYGAAPNGDGTDLAAFMTFLTGGVGDDANGVNDQRLLGGAMGTIHTQQRTVASDGYDLDPETAGSFLRKYIGGAAPHAGAADYNNDGTVDNTTKISIASNLGEENAITDIAISFNSVSYTDMFSSDSDYGSVQGGSTSTSIVVYDSLGNPKEATMQMTLVARDTNFSTWRWVADSTDDTDATWNFGAFNDPAAPTTSINIGTGLIRFDQQGRYVKGVELSATGGLEIDRDDMGTSEPIQIGIQEGLSADQAQDLDFSDMTSVAAANDFNLDNQDGSASGTLDSFTVTSDGIINGVYSNGVIEVLGQIAVALVPNPNGMIDWGSNLFIEGAASGEPQVSVPQSGGRGSIRSGHLELSNVDLSEEFTNMIVTQRGFQANARIITTSDEMLQELVNLKR
jgi:flagellar hook-basal body protein